jgi:hypothetical protein
MPLPLTHGLHRRPPLAGLDAPIVSPAEVARYTVRTCLRSVPGAVPGIHFLSGGMSEEEATLNLQALQASAMPLFALTCTLRRWASHKWLNEGCPAPGVTHGCVCLVPALPRPGVFTM